MEKTPLFHIQKRIQSLLPSSHSRTPSRSRSRSRSQPKYLFLAGDIGDPFLDSYWDFLKGISVYYEKVFLVTGNKEYDLNHPLQDEIGLVHQHIHESMYKYRLDNVYFLDERRYETPEMFVIGTCLWTIPHTTSKKESYCNDQYMASLFHSNVQLLHSEIIQCHQTNPHKPIVVLTHFAPTKKGVNSPGTEDDGFHSIDLSSYLPTESFSLVRMFVYGHTHYNPPKNCIQRGSQRFVTNQVGHNTTRFGTAKPLYGFQNPMSIVL